MSLETAQERLDTLRLWTLIDINYFISFRKTFHLNLDVNPGRVQTFSPILHGKFFPKNCEDKALYYREWGLDNHGGSWGLWLGKQGEFEEPVPVYFSSQGDALVIGHTIDEALRILSSGVRTNLETPVKLIDVSKSLQHSIEHFNKHLDEQGVQKVYDPIPALNRARDKFQESFENWIHDGIVPTHEEFDKAQEGYDDSIPWYAYPIVFGILALGVYWLFGGF